MSGQKTIQKSLKTGKVCPEHFPMYQRCQEFFTINTSIYISNLLQYGYFSVNKEGTYACQMGNNGRLPQFNGVVFLCFFITIQSGSRIRHLLRFLGSYWESANRDLLDLEHQLYFCLVSRIQSFSLFSPLVWLCSTIKLSRKIFYALLTQN